MAGLLLISMLLEISVPIYNFPALSDSCEIIIVMMEDGLLPENAWEGIFPWQREEFWTLACSGMMIQRAGWSGYLLLCPLGVGAEILETAENLAEAEVTADNSAMCIGMQLHPVSDCPSSILFFSASGDDPPPDRLPLRTSTWLHQESDTLMINSSTEGDAFFWTDLPDSVSLLSAAWRGIGTEIVPAGSTSVRVAFSCVHGSIPSNLSYVDIEPHPIDDMYMNTWGLALSMVDSLIADLYPLRQDPGHLLWIRGSGTAPPWRSSSSPTPPTSAEYVIALPDNSATVSMPGIDDPSTIPAIVEIELPGKLSSPANGAIIEAVLERIIGRDFISQLEDEVYFDVVCGNAGEVSIWLVNQDEDEPLRDDDFQVVLETLRNSILVPPGHILIRNAAIRASLLQGRVQNPPNVYVISMELMNILFPD